MKATYFDDEDTLVIRLSDKPIVREVSQDWRTHIAFAADGSVVETVIARGERVGRLANDRGAPPSGVM